MREELITKKSLINGIGVFTKVHFNKGAIVKKLDDSRIVDSENPLNIKKGEHEHHCDWLENSKQILMPIPERYINHSCQPNTYVKTLNGLRYVIALNEIEIGEEITYDYLLNCDGGDLWKCNCGEPNCRKNIPSSFFHLPQDEQEKLKPLLDSWFTKEHASKMKNISIK